MLTSWIRFVLNHVLIVHYWWGFLSLTMMMIYSTISSTYRKILLLLMEKVQTSFIVLLFMMMMLLVNEGYPNFHGRQKFIIWSTKKVYLDAHRFIGQQRRTTIKPSNDLSHWEVTSISEIIITNFPMTNSIVMVKREGWFGKHACGKTFYFHKTFNLYFKDFNYFFVAHILVSQKFGCAMMLISNFKMFHYHLNFPFSLLEQIQHPTKHISHLHC